MDCQGVHLGGHTLEQAICDRIRDWTAGVPCRLVPAPPGGPERLPYDRTRPVTTRYVYDEQALLENPDIQRLACDPSILAAAQAYLRCNPVLSSCIMWWSTAFSPVPSNAAAQMYHFDMSRIRFVKFFFYLTDVHEHNGPHVYVLGSHRRLPAALRREDRRFTDEEVLRNFEHDRVLKITGPAGTMFMADTRGLHKGQHLIEGDRLVLELHFSTCNFGEQHDDIVISEPFSDEFWRAVDAYPYTYSRFVRPSANRRTHQPTNN